MTCADPRAPDDGDVPASSRAWRGADADVLHRGAGIAATLRLLRRGGVCAELDDVALLDDVARGWGSGDAGAQVYVLRAIKAWARVAREDHAKAPAAARRKRRRVADAARAAAASARRARRGPQTQATTVSALERLSGDAGLEELDAPRATFDGLRRCAGSRARRATTRGRRRTEPRDATFPARLRRPGRRGSTPTRGARPGLYATGEETTEPKNGRAF